MNGNIETVKYKRREDTGIEKNWLYKTFKTALSCPIKISERVDRAIDIVSNESFPTKGSKKPANGKYSVNMKKRAVEYLINRKSQASAMFGGATAIPGTIPGLGTVGTIATAVSSELIAVTKLEIELCLEIACLYGWDIRSEDRVWEVLSIMAKSGRKPTHEDEILRKMIERAVKTGLVRLIRNVSRRIGLRIFKRVIFKIIPWIGIPVGAGYNLKSTREIGYVAESYYKNGKRRKKGKGGE